MIQFEVGTGLHKDYTITLIERTNEYDGKDRTDKLQNGYLIDPRTNLAFQGSYDR